jgi:hypothetical protein
VFFGMFVLSGLDFQSGGFQVVGKKLLTSKFGCFSFSVLFLYVLLDSVFLALLVFKVSFFFCLLMKS